MAWLEKIPSVYMFLKDNQQYEFETSFIAWILGLYGDDDLQIPTRSQTPIFSFSAHTIRRMRDFNANPSATLNEINNQYPLNRIRFDRGTIRYADVNKLYVSDERIAQYFSAYKHLNEYGRSNVIDDDVKGLLRASPQACVVTNEYAAEILRDGNFGQNAETIKNQLKEILEEGLNLNSLKGNAHVHITVEEHEEDMSDEIDMSPSLSECHDLIMHWMSQAFQVRHMPIGFNLILEGVPGTGKTYALQRLRQMFEIEWEEASPMMGDAQGKYAITMHPSTSYEDFVEGIRPTIIDTSSSYPEFIVDQLFKEDVDRWFYDTIPQNESAQFRCQDGFFLKICKEALSYPDKVFIVLLDELNRCNLPKVMGDLLTTLETSKRATFKNGAWNVDNAQIITLPYSQRAFFVPENIYIIGTMNTTDRSVAPMDAALRRRFQFVRLWPLQFNPMGNDTQEWQKLTNDASPLEMNSINLWLELNTVLQKYGADAMLGHSYLFEIKSEIQKYKTIKDIIVCKWNLSILPQLIDSLISNNLTRHFFKDQENGNLNNIAVLKDKVPSCFKIKFEYIGSGLLKRPTLWLDVKETE